MMGILSRLWPAILVVLVGVGLWLHGQETGFIKCEAAHKARLEEAQAKIAEAAKRTAEAEAARLIAEDERARISRELEDAAHADPVAYPSCLSPDRVRRLNSR